MQAIAGLALLSFLLFGCQATPKRVAFTTLNGVAIAVDAARGAYIEAYRAGKIDPATHGEVIAIDNKFSAAMNTAISAAEINWSSPPTSELQLLALQLITTIEKIIK